MLPPRDLARLPLLPYQRFPPHWGETFPYFLPKIMLFLLILKSPQVPAIPSPSLPNSSSPLHLPPLHPHQVPGSPIRLLPPLLSLPAGAPSHQAQGPVFILRPCGCRLRAPTSSGTTVALLTASLSFSSSRPLTLSSSGYCVCFWFLLVSPIPHPLPHECSHSLPQLQLQCEVTQIRP